MLARCLNCTEPSVSRPELSGGDGPGAGDRGHQPTGLPGPGTQTGRPLRPGDLPGHPRRGRPPEVGLWGFQNDFYVQFTHSPSYMLEMSSSEVNA